MKPILVPALWVDEGLELNDEMSDLIKGDLTYVLLIITALQWTFVGIGVALVIGMLIWYFIARNKMSKAKTTSVEPIFTVSRGEVNETKTQ